MHSTTNTLSLALLLVLGGCASDTASRMGTAATTPLSDLGIKKADIPAVLTSAKEQPYLLPIAHGCAAIALEIGKLDEALGPDLDVPDPEEASTMDKANKLANDQVVGAVQRTAEGLVPFRGWVRKLSGAERYSSHVSECVMAGSVRRAFLKGVAAAQGCALPAAPLETKKA
nr:hypothetical protein [uncultured Massilia sp.]